ncbi:putative RNA-directed DNA polymerase [Tanacetum coccineum]
MKEEYDALMKNGRCSLVPCASKTNVVDGKWVYRLKRDKNGAITCYKARFVAKGFRKQPGINFHETFSLVVKSTTIRAILSLAVTNNWPLRQLDVHNAFLHGNLKEQVYMKQTSGFIDPQRPNHVCLLHKSLYGLKQAPRAWFERLSKALFDIGFKGSKTDPSLFIYSCGYTLLYILVYVDDIIVICNNRWALSVTYIFVNLDRFALKRSRATLTLLRNPNTSLEAFLDADWEGIQTIDAEYKALADTVAGLTWLQALLHELGTDIAKITRKEPKIGQKRTRDGMSTQEPGIIKLWSTKVNHGQA